MNQNSNIDESLKNEDNSKFGLYTTTKYTTEGDQNHILFATSQPILVAGSAWGSGAPSSSIDNESFLLYATTPERHFEKLQLFERPFVTVPYLGRGASNPELESQLLQGQSFMGGGKDKDVAVYYNKFTPSPNPTPNNISEIKEISTRR